MTGDAILKEGLRVLEVEAEALKRLIATLDHQFVEAVELCYSTAGRIVVIGMGKSGIIGKKIAATLASTGTPAFFLHPAEAIHGDLGMVSKDDLIILLSYSGETEEVLKLVPALKRLNLTIITLTGSVKSSLAKMSNLVLDVAVSEEACPLGLAPTASTTATLGMGDALAIALLSKRGFKKEDFASFHPGGTLGRNLLLKVCDVMHKGKSIPVVKESALMHEAILEMTSKKLGMTTLVSENGTLSGVITDGDLRRLILPASNEKRPDIFFLPVKEVMNRQPKTIREEALITEAIHVMETYSITTLVVVDERHVVAGVVHLHDILKIKAV
jgi:arabinose-5-phosphate isomerase